MHCPTLIEPPYIIMSLTTIMNPMSFLWTAIPNMNPQHAQLVVRDDSSVQTSYLEPWTPIPTVGTW